MEPSLNIQMKTKHGFIVKRVKLGVKLGLKLGLLSHVCIDPSTYKGLHSSYNSTRVVVKFLVDFRWFFSFR